MPRRKGKGGLGVERGERYALIPEDVMTSVAYGAQPDFSIRVLNALCCGYLRHMSLPGTSRIGRWDVRQRVRGNLRWLPE
jgi:hypothetical protein